VRAALIVVALVLGSIAEANPSQDLDAANQAFRSGQLATALPLYNALLYPPPPRLANTNEVVEAYVNLGVCRVDAGDVDGAKREFEKALQLDPNKQLDPLLINNKEAVRLFDDTKADIRNRARDAEAKQQLADLLKEREAYRKSLVVYRSHPFYQNFVPFGTGQFQNGDTPKGVAFAAGEGLTFATSIAIWGYLVNTYGISNHNLNISRDEAVTIHNLQVAEVGTGIAFFTLYVWGVIDAYRHYQPQVRVKADDSLLPPNLRNLDPPKPPKKTSLLDRMHVVPIVTPNGAGIGVGWEQ
jgi:tetratricopeptide (TPR) repeat protein